MGWVSPTGFEDPESAFINEANAYDGNSGTYSAIDGGLLQYEESDWLVFTHASLSCNGIRYNTYHTGNYTALVTIEVYDGSWHNVVTEDTPNHQAWKEVSFGAYPGVTKTRIMWKSTGTGVYSCYLYELEFGEAAAIDATIEAVLAAISSEALVSTFALDRIFSAPLVAITSEALIPSLLRDMIFGVPIISVNAETPNPEWGMVMVIYAPVVEINSNAVVFHPPVTTIGSEGYVPSFMRDMILQPSVAILAGEVLIPEILVLEETVIQAPVVAINAQGLTPNLVRDIIFGVPVAIINAEGPTPILSLSLTLLPPLTSIDAEALAALVSRGILIEPGVIAIDSQAFPPGLSLDRVLIPSLVAIDSQALSPSLSLGKTLLSSLATIGASAPTPALFPFGRLLVIKVTTSQYRKIQATTSQYRKVHAVPSMKRKIKITTDGGR